MTSSTCSCGDRSRPNINHRVRIPCYTFIGKNRHDICSACGSTHIFNKCPFPERAQARDLMADLQASLGMRPSTTEESNDD